VYGELLINSLNLKDNARRDWFKMDEYSLGLKYQIIDFMKRLYKYRYAASNYFNNEIAEKSNNLKDELKEALINLVQYNQNKTEYMVDVMISDAPEKRKTESTNTYSDEDAPRETKLFKKNYDKIMTIVEKYYIAQNNFEEFLKLRAFMKNTLQGDKANTDE
jgi:molecular chaperone HtpG